MKRIKNLSPLDFAGNATAKVSTGREKQKTQDEKFKILLRKQIAQLQNRKLVTSQFTQSLLKTHDREFRERIFPAINWY
jgi:hypothetical protein